MTGPGSPAIPAQEAVISTVAGGGPDEVPATSIFLNAYGVALDSRGVVYLSAPYRIFRVDRNGTLVTVAGGGGSGDGAHATRARVNPLHLAFDAADNLFFVDNFSSVRRVDAVTGLISTVAGGGGACCESGDGGPAVGALLDFAWGVAVDPTGNLYISEFGADRVRRVDAATGIITTVAGTGSPGFSGDGGPADMAQLHEPKGLALDGTEGLIIADASNHRIRRVDLATGTIETIAGNGASGFGGDGGAATSASLIYPSGVAVDSAGNVFFSDYNESDGDGPWYSRVRRVDAVTGVITRVAGGDVCCNLGNGGPATSANLYYPEDVAVAADGTFFVADLGHLFGGLGAGVRRVDGTTGIITGWAGGGTGHGDGGLATNGELVRPDGLAYDAAGNLYIADAGNYLIRRVEATTGVITTVAGGGPCCFGGDGGPAVGASLRQPAGVAVDASGNVFFADTWNHRIRKISSSNGFIYTVYGNGTESILKWPYDVDVDAQGRLLIADTYHFRVLRDGTVIAGNGVQGYGGDDGPATQANLSQITGVAADAEGNVYIADRDNDRIRRVDDATGVITTVAGTGTPGFSGDGGPATAADLNVPSGVAIGAGGDLLIADEGNGRVRRVDLATGLIETVAGNGALGFCGDGGPATEACTYFASRPVGVAASPSGDVAFTDVRNHRIRAVTPLLPAPAAVPDGGRVYGAPLMVRPAPGGAITLTWSPSPFTSDTDFAVYEGSIQNFDSHVPVACATGGATGLTLTPQPGDTYYLVVPTNGLDEGSYGMTNLPVERGPGPASCLPQQVGAYPYCGDGRIVLPERCEGTNLNGETCSGLGFDGGTLGCASSCMYDTSACTLCGNGVMEEGEACDGADLGAAVCADVGFDGGSLACDASCALVTAGCTTICGDGVRRGDEECDGADFGGATCATLDFAAGSLACDAACRFDTGGCITLCGDGVAQGPEVCDGADFPGHDCGTEGFDGGSLVCNPSCDGFSTSGCTLCGNGVREGAESCDGADLGGAFCQDYGFTAGSLTCRPECLFDFSACTTCGNNAREGAEVCDGSDLAGQTCLSRGFTGGTLGCHAACTAFVESGCTACGNGVREGGEVCDGADLAGATCEALGYPGGDLGCAPSCLAYDTTLCFN